MHMWILILSNHSCMFIPFSRFYVAKNPIEPFGSYKLGTFEAQL